MGQSLTTGASARGDVLRVLCDGASQGNPGPAGIGVVVLSEAGEVLDEVSEFIGRATNNQAEYAALLRGLEAAAALGARHVRIAMDSELVVRQMQGRYRVRNRGLRPLWERARQLAERFEAVQFEAVPRHVNWRADALAGKAIAASAAAPRT